MHEQHHRLAAFRAGQKPTVYPSTPAGLVFRGDAGIPDSIAGNE